MADSPLDEPQPADPMAPRLPTALVYNAAMLDHLVPDEFPEIPERLRFAMAMIDGLIADGTLAGEKLLRLDARPATLEELSAVHAPEYVERVRLFVERLMEGNGYEATPRRFATDVYLSPGSYTAANLAAGAPLVALD